MVSVALPFATGDSYLMAAIPVWDTMLLPVYYVAARMPCTRKMPEARQLKKVKRIRGH